MIKEAIDRIIELAAPEKIEINGETYSNQHLHRISETIPIETLDLNSLQGLVNYIQHNIETEFDSDKCM